MSKLPLDRILQSQGFGTRKWCRELVEDGEVCIGSDTVTDSRSTFETGGLKFSVYGEPWKYREHVYIALNKPADTNARASPAIIPACFPCCRSSSHCATCSPSAASITTPPACC